MIDRTFCVAPHDSWTLEHESGHVEDGSMQSLHMDILQNKLHVLIRDNSRLFFFEKIASGTTPLPYQNLFVASVLHRARCISIRLVVNGRGQCGKNSIGNECNPSQQTFGVTHDSALVTTTCRDFFFGFVCTNFSCLPMIMADCVHARTNTGKYHSQTCDFGLMTGANNRAPWLIA